MADNAWLKKRGYILKRTPGISHWWVDGCYGYCVVTAASRDLAIDMAVSMIKEADKHAKKGVITPAWHFTDRR